MNAGIVDARQVFGKAQWIWPTLWGYDIVNYFMQARRAFSLTAVPHRCVVKVTADTRYKLLVNGVHVCSGPARGFPLHIPYDEVDIAPYLKRGANCIAMTVQCYGKGTFSYISADAGGAILLGKAGSVDISTGPEWLVRRGPGYKRHTTQISTQLGFEEFFDARMDDGSWILPTYKVRGKRVTDADLVPFDSAWSKPHCRAAGVMPWHFVEPRMIPMLSEEVIAPKTIVSGCEGKSASGWRDAANLTELFLRDKRAWHEPSAKLAATRSFAQLAVASGTTAGFRSYILDFGREIVGSIIIEASGAAGGEVVDMQTFETIAGLAPEVVSPYVDCQMAMSNRLTLRKGTTRHEQFDHWGFRYVAVTVRGNARPLKLRVSLRTALYPLEIKAAFRSSDRRLNDIYRICVRTQECCMIDSYVDCPWREQAQWWGDARVQAANTHHLSADSRLFKRGIRLIAGQEVPNGLTYGMTPSRAHQCILPDYTLTWVMTVWDYYFQTGDKSLIAEQADRIRRALSYFEDITAANGLLPYDNRYWLFLDWADIFKQGYPTVYNIFYFWALKTAAKLFDLIGEHEEAARYRALGRAVRAAIMTHLFDARTATFYGGLDFRGKRVPQDSPHAYALAVVSGLCRDYSERFVAEHLLSAVRGEYPGIAMDVNLAYLQRTTPSSFFMHYVFEALKAHGHQAEVIDCIRRWWGVFLDWGLSTVPENWDPPAGMLSACHAWSAHPIVHLHNIILGVTQKAFAWKLITFAPTFIGTSASGKVSTPLGEIEVSWKRSGDTADVRLVIPKGMAARVKLPGVVKTAYRGRYHWTVKLGS